jgi:phosphoenolpyruvate-protein kinase (PTS system EI component)
LKNESQKQQNSLRLKLKNLIENQPKSFASSYSYSYTAAIVDIGYHLVGADDYENIQLDESQTKEATEKNKTILNEKFDKMQKNIEKARENALKKLDKLSPQQQKDVIKFWDLASELIEDVLSWIQDLFTNIVNKIREGFKLAASALKDFFNMVKNIFKQITN